MRKSIAATFQILFLWLANTNPFKAYWLIAVLFLAGCIATENRWEASQMRAQVMRYYNDEIMENLIRANEHLPFVHVDITGLTNIDTSQIAGTFGGGETRVSTKTSPSMVGVVGTLSRAVTWPFSYSVTPNRGNSLQISAAPVLAPLPADPVTKKVQTIYDLYDKFLKQRCPNAPLVGPKDLVPRPSESDYVEGTLKLWHGRYYYVDKACQVAYEDFCRKLFTKGQTSSLAKELQSTQTAIEGVRGLQALPPPPSP